MSESVLTRVVDPTGWNYLDNSAPVKSLTWEWTYPGGPTSASFNLDADPAAQPRHLTQGATLTTHRGGVTWKGRVASIDRDGWKVAADGLAALVAQEPVGVVGTLDAIVDAAIANGLPLTRPASLSTTTWTNNSSGSSTDLTGVTLDQPLTDVLTAEGKFWRVTLDGQIIAETAPTTPALIVATDMVLPLTLNAYATRVNAIYVNTSGTTLAIQLVNAAAEARFGRKPVAIDLTRLGNLSAAAATAKAQAYLDLASPRMMVSGDLTVQPGQVTTASGGAVDLALLRPGVVARVQLVTLYRDALAIPSSAVDMLLGHVSYDADAGTATLSPVASALDPVAVLFGGRATATVLGAKAA